MLRSSPSTYGLVAILLHWLVALLIIGQIVMGLAMVRLADQRLAFDLIQWHKSFGLLTLALVALRIAWRLSNRPPPLPAGMPRWERRAARAAHAMLYAVMVALPVTGWLLVSASVLAIPTYAFYLFVVPHLPVARSEPSELLWTSAHHLLAYSTIVLVVLHAGAALRHHFLLRDDVLRRILSPRGREGNKLDRNWSIRWRSS